MRRRLLIEFLLVAIALSGVACDSPDSGNGGNNSRARTVNITVNGRMLTAVMEDNSSASTLLEQLVNGPVTVEMEDYASMEKVGSLGFSVLKILSSLEICKPGIFLLKGFQPAVHYEIGAKVHGKSERESSFGCSCTLVNDAHFVKYKASIE
ncbi:MAG: hypothetical protein IAA97_04000 [Spirochaetes bacterium]|uniref:Cyclophilin-like domain-containing protein n=1 Tax=Candidatus Ornithospirochaeta stercoripullorum TaxID=2840899 RepID=A0A9D9DYW0_9SPIO|nr:hypothetical protein [Candidatus Ornithospirochaeta stercoripullorum]